MALGLLSLLVTAGSAYQQNRQNKKAAEGFNAAAGQAAARQESRYQQSRIDVEPWRASGTKALRGLDELMYGNPEEQMESLRSTPGYQFRLDEGLKALTRSSLAGSVSGNTFRGMQQYGQEYASKEFGRRFSRLEGMAGEGRQASQWTGEQGANAAALSGQYSLQGAEAIAGAQIGQGKIIGDTLGSLVSTGNDIYNRYNNNKPTALGGNFYDSDRVAPGGAFAPSTMYPKDSYEYSDGFSEQAQDYGGNY